MNELNTTVMERSKKNSIYYCLSVLGVPDSELYAKCSSGNKLLSKKANTIYERWSKIDIYNYAKHLKKIQLRKYHPDINKGSEVCLERTKLINEAFDMLVKILEGR